MSDFSVPSEVASVDLVGDKIAIRSVLVTARRALTSADTAEDSLRVWLHLSDLVRAAQPPVIATYEPFGTEPCAHLTTPLTELLSRSTALRVLVPVHMPDNDLDWRDWAEPDGLGVDAIATADLVIVPALAVDETGVRLGRGGGSYDRALARVRPGVQIVALLHDGELAHRLPAEPHDRRVTAVITPTDGMIRLPR